MQNAKTKKKAKMANNAFLKKGAKQKKKKN